jgi:uncharacterized protein (TIGR03086 family)
VAGLVFRRDLFAGFDGTAFVSGDRKAAQDAWRARRDDLLAALARPDALNQPSMSPFGHESITAWLGFLFYDTVVHTWDLARATEQPVVLDDGLVTRAHETLAAADARYDLRVPMSLAPARSVPANASTLDRLIALAGRDPAWVAPPPTM